MIEKMIEKNTQRIKEGIMKGRTRIPYEQYIEERINYWVENIATPEQLENTRNKINYTLYEYDQLSKQAETTPLDEKTASN